MDAPLLEPSLLLAKPPVETLRLFSIEEVCDALQAKMEAEERENGFHIGLIADGNRRYGVSMGKSKSWGHVQGARTIREVFLPLMAQIPQITECSLYLLSNSNLKDRPIKELGALDQLFEDEYEELSKLAKKHNFRYEHAGDMENLAEKMPKMAGRLKDLVRETRGHTGLRVNLCINYQSNTELGYAAKQWVKKMLSGEEAIESLDTLSYAEIAQRIYEEAWVRSKTDFVFRSGGTHGFSGFVGGRANEPNCRLEVAEEFLPQIHEQRILQALFNFAMEERRMGR